MKILINRKPVEGPWGGGNLLVKAFHEHMPYLGYEVFDSFQNNLDIIFLQDPRPGNTGISINEAVKYKSFFPNVKIIQRVNECDARKDTDWVDQMLLDCSSHIDATIFVSNWMMNYHLEKGWKCDNNAVIYNGVNSNHFKKNKKIKNGKINIVTHHWSNNYLKGFDIYDALDDFVGDNENYVFTYVGRHRGTFKNTNIVEPMHGEELGSELGKHDVYVSASRYDPGPNHILESLSCELPTYVHTEGGGCVEFAGHDHVFKNFEDLKQILTARQFKNNNFKNHSWKKCIENFDKFIKETF